MPTRFAKPAVPLRAFACCAWKTTTKSPPPREYLKKNPPKSKNRQHPDVHGCGLGARRAEVVARPGPRGQPSAIHHLHANFVIAPRVGSGRPVAESVLPVQLAADLVDGFLDGAVAHGRLIRTSRCGCGHLQWTIAHGR